MISFVNPAASLTAGRVPVAAAGGVLADSGISISGISLTSTGLVVNRAGAAGSLPVSEEALTVRTNNGGLGRVMVRLLNENVGVAESASLSITSHDVEGFLGAFGSNYGLPAVAGSFQLSAPRVCIVSNGGANSIEFHQGFGVEKARFLSGDLLLGRSTSNAAGKLQVADHTTAAGGIGFRSGMSLFSSSATTLETNAATFKCAALTATGTATANWLTATNAVQGDYFNIAGGTGGALDFNGLVLDGVRVVSTAAPGWTDPSTWTGAGISRAALDTATCTVAQLAQVVQGLLYDLYSNHRLIKT